MLLIFPSFLLLLLISLGVVKADYGTLNYFIGVTCDGSPFAQNGGLTNQCLSFNGADWYIL